MQGTFDPIVQAAALDPQQLGPTGGVLGGYGSGKSVIPDVPTEGFTPVAVMKIVTAGATFVPGTTTTVAGSSFRNVSVLPVGLTF